MPLALIHLSTFVNKSAPSASFAIKPIAYVVVSIGVDESAVSIVDIISKLSFIDNMVDLFTDASHLAIWTQLPNDVLIVLTLAESQRLINWVI